VRGFERKEIPKIFTKVAKTIPKVSANAALAKPKEIAIITSGIWYVDIKESIIRYSLTNPLKKGKPEIESTPTKKRREVQGILLTNPPNFSIFAV